MKNVMKVAAVAVSLVGVGANADGPGRRLSCMQSPDGGVYDCMPVGGADEGGSGPRYDTTTTDTGQIEVGGEVNAVVVKGTWKVRGPSQTTTTYTPSRTSSSTDGGSK